MRRALLALVLTAIAVPAAGPVVGQDGPLGTAAGELTPLDVRVRELEERRRPTGWIEPGGAVPLAPEEVEARKALAAGLREFAAAVATAERPRIARQARLVEALKDRLQRTSLEVLATASPASAEVPTTAEVRSWLRPEQAVVLYGRAGDRLTAVVITSRRAEEIDLGDDLDLHDAAKSAHEALEADSGDPSEAVGRLRSLVVAPLRLEDEVRTVFLGASGALASLPAAALLPGRAVAVLPCLSVLRARPAARPARGGPVLAVGNPAFRPGATPERTLPGARREARDVDEGPLLGEDATRAALLARLATVPRWRALHMAGIVEADAERPLLSAFGLATTDADDGYWTAREIAQQRIPADLVVLSACLACGTQSAPDAGVMALPCAFLAAGVPSVVGFLGRLDDEAGAAFSRAFYAELQKGTGTAEAVRRAQEAVRRDPRWAHPRFWVGWTLWGAAD